MKKHLLKSALLLLVATCSVNLMATNFEIDLRDGQLGTDKTNPTTKYLTIDGETYNYSDAAPAEYVAILSALKYNGTQHGYQDLVVTIPVIAGTYKVTLGTCQYSNGAGSVEAGTATLKSFNQNTGVCYHENTSSNVIYVIFNVDEAQTIVVDCGNFTPYIKFEKLENVEYVVTFTKGVDVEGLLPATSCVVQGNSITIPVNRTLYKDGYTLTGWNDGDTDYAIGENYTPATDVTMTPVFTANTGSIVTATSEVTVQWNFGLNEGAPSVSWQGRTGDFLVAQANVGGNPMDVKLTIDTKKESNNGKFLNSGRKDFYAQVNANTLFTFPSKKNINVEVYTYADPATSTLDGNTKTGDWSSNKATFNTTNESGTSVFEVKDGQYYRYLKVTYPGEGTVAISNTNANANTVKFFRDGQLLIERDGRTYNMQGQIIK